MSVTQVRGFMNPSSNRAAIYCRVSSAIQETDGTSLDTQEIANRQYGVEHGYVIDDGQVFRETHSGFDLWERKKLALLREAVRRGDIDVVVVYAVDRLARNQAHLYILSEEFERSGVRLEFVSEPFENSAVGKFLRSAKAFAAEVEREKFKERSLRGKRARVSAGRLLHGKTPLYGYDWADEKRDRYIVNPLTSRIVQRIFEEYAQGRSLRAIGLGLGSDGISTPRGGNRWDFSTVALILKDGRYVGDAYAFRIRQFKENGRVKHEIRPQEEWVALPDGVIPAIVRRDLFDTAAQRLHTNKKNATRRLANPEAYLLRSRVRCGHCGYTMAARNSTSRDRQYHSYACTRYSKGWNDCPSHTISNRVLDQVAWQRVESLLLDPHTVERELTRLQEEDPTITDLETVERQLANLDRQMSNLVAHLANLPAVAGEAVRRQIAALSQEHERLQTERDVILARRSVWNAAISRIGDVKTWCRRVSERLSTVSFEEKRQVIETLDVEATVYRAHVQPRFIITATIPLTDQMGQDSIFCVESQNIHS